MQAHIVEMFSSIQGEGKYVGYRQLFIRLAGCNLACAYCDTASSRQLAPSGQIEQTPGQRDFVTVKNPLPVEELIRYSQDLLELRHHSVSFTGGEPLCQAEVIAALAPRLGAKVYLETNGTLPDELRAVLPFISYVSMDIKLPSVTGQEHWAAHERFLKLAAAKDVFVKVVLSGETSQDEFDQAIGLVAAVDPVIPLVLQPVTPLGAVSAVSPETVLHFQAKALAVLSDVRVIPQTHKFIGQL